MKVGLDTHQHEAGECYTRKIADHWEDGRNCGDPRCEEAIQRSTDEGIHLIADMPGEDSR